MSPSMAALNSAQLQAQIRQAQQQSVKPVQQQSAQQRVAANQQVMESPKKKIEYKGLRFSIKLIIEKPLTVDIFLYTKNYIARLEIMRNRREMSLKGSTLPTSTVIFKVGIVLTVVD